jgi:hypothetical protein
MKRHYSLSVNRTGFCFSSAVRPNQHNFLYIWYEILMADQSTARHLLAEIRTEKFGHRLRFMFSSGFESVKAIQDFTIPRRRSYCDQQFSFINYFKQLSIGNSRHDTDQGSENQPT